MSVNPFDTEKFQMLNCSTVYPPTVYLDCSEVFAIGKEQYKDFIQTRFVLGSKDVVQTSLKKNNLMIMKHWKVAASQSTEKIKLIAAELTKLRAASEVRIEAAQELFSKEFTNMPVCLVYKDGNVYHSEKSDILKDIDPSING